MAILPTDPPTAETHADGVPDSEHLKQVPPLRATRGRIRELVHQLTDGLDKTRPLAKHQIETHARSILDQLELPEGYVGWTMVVLASSFWRGQVERVPYHRRLLLLPHCLKDAENCPAEYNQLGLLCEDCGACDLTDLRATAEQKGYRVLIAEGSPIVMQFILTGQADAVLGVGCLNSLEKALDKILLVGLPSMAVALHDSKCSNTSTDEDWIREMIETPYRSGGAITQTRVHLLRCAAGMFDRDELARLVPPLRGEPSRSDALQPRVDVETADDLETEPDVLRLDTLEPLAVTETIARDFLLQGGKYFRPFITLATYDALTGGHAAGPDGADHVARLPDAVKRVAMAMEVFHKASLVHDDIEDDDGFRYGRRTVHRRFGTATAINVGDYLVGLGYRLVASQQERLSAEVVADILGQLSDAHTRLCEGQGAELAWRLAKHKRLAPLDALKIYALKTSPAFEVALYTGLRMAGSARAYREPAARFARHLGVAFQILNDLEDWRPEPTNKRTAGGDVLGGRPTVLWAMAAETLDHDDCHELESLASQAADTPNASDVSETTLARVREFYEQADVYRKAADLVTKHRRRAREIADRVAPDELRRLLHYFVETVVPKTRGRW